MGAEMSVMAIETRRAMSDEHAGIVMECALRLTGNLQDISFCR